MRKLAIIFILGILLLAIPTASATLDVKHYDKNTKTVRISEWFGLVPVLDIQLISNTDQCLIDCEALFNVTVYKDASLNSKWSFYDRHNLEIFKGKRLKDYSILIQKAGFKDKKVPVYTTKKLENGTTEKVLDKHITKKEKYLYWDSWDGSKLKKGSYLVKLKARKSPEESIEWIPTIRGLKINEWAWWNSDWSRRKEVNISGGSVQLTNFTVYLVVEHETEMQPDYDDLRFTNTAGTEEYDYDLDWYNSTEAGVWVRIPTLNTGINTIYMYYGNAGASSGEDKINAWDSSYGEVYHFNNDSDIPNVLKSGCEIVKTGSWSTRAESGWNFGNQSVYIDGTGESNYGTFTGCDDHPEAKNNFTILIWLEPVTISSPDPELNAIYEWGQGWTTYLIQRQMDTANRPAWEVRGTSAGYDVGSSGSDLGAYGSGIQQHLVTVNDTYVSTYHDGDLIERVSTPAYASYGSDKLLMKYHNQPGGKAYITELRYIKDFVTDEWVAREYQNQNSSTVVFGTEEQTLTSTIEYPPNNLYTTNATVNFNCSATATGTTLDNITLYIWNNTNLITTNTSTATGTYDSASWEIDLDEDNFTFNCLASGNSGAVLDWDSNRTLYIDRTAPSITIDIPLHQGGYPISIVPFNFSITDTNIDSCWYNLDLNTSNTSLPLCDNSQLTIDATTHTLILYANDSAGNENFATSIFDGYNITDETFINETVEGDSTSIGIAIELNVSNVDLDAILFYNNTAYQFPDKSNTSTHYIFNETLTVPLVESNMNKSFFWNLSFSSVINQTTTLNNQTVYQLGFADCSAGSSGLALNFSLWHEADSSYETGDLDITSTLWGGSATINRTNATGIDNQHEFLFCISPTWASYTGNIELDYVEDGRARRTYYMSEATISNNTQNISLYMINTSDDLEFQITVLDESQDAVEGAFVNVQRYYRDLGLTKTVEILKTDASGRDIAHFAIAGEEYQLVVTIDGVIRHTGLPFKPYCPQSAAGDPCIREIRLGYGSTNLKHREYEGWSDLLYYDNDTEQFIYTWTDTTGSVHTGRLYVVQRGITDTVICNKTTSGATGTITCNVSSYNSNGELYAWAYNTHSMEDFEQFLTVLFTEYHETFGADGVFWAAVLLIAVIFIGLATHSLIATGIFIIIGLVMVKIIGFVFIPMYALMGLITVLVVLIWRFKSG